MYSLVLYTTERGDSPIDEFLDGLDKKSRAKVAAHLSLLEEQGPNLKRPYADIVRGKIRELSQQLKEKDIELSERRMEDWIRRFTSGGGT